MIIKRVTHCQPYLTQSQVERILYLLETHPRKADASLRGKLRDALSKARVSDEKHAQWLAEHGR